MPDLQGLYGLPPGVDFPVELVAGLLERFRDRPPEDLARVEIIVNTQRLRRRVFDAFADGSARLLPKIKLVSDLADTSSVPAASPLRRTLDLTNLVAALIESNPKIAPRGDAFALAESLGALLAEMEDEGVSHHALHALDVGEVSEHWERALQFLGIVGTYQETSGALGPNAVLRRAVIARLAQWQTTPPTDPVILAGSTGSRGTTHMLMRAVARLPLGAVVLPGFDFDNPRDVWATLAENAGLEDHPQYRFAALSYGLDTKPESVQRWRGGDPRALRNSVVSLALRPAPVTDQWIAEGPTLGALPDRLAGVDLIEASDPRHEALAVALCLRNAVEDGKRAALVTPDRTLARRVTAELDRWRILPDDSAGRPLSLTAPGRLLRQVADAAANPVSPAALMALAKHPLTHSGEGRGDHLRRTADLELWLREQARPKVDGAQLAAWAGGRDAAEDKRWALWLAEFLNGSNALASPLAAHVAHHQQVAEVLASGALATGAGRLWQDDAGAAALSAMHELSAEAGLGRTMSSGEYARLFDGFVAGIDVRIRAEADPRIAIWGTLDARVQGADLVVLAGLNDGIWPALASPDPWLNRQMRRDLGLRSPERQVGLAAHDFQQAIAAKHVVMSRAVRDADTPTVMSRWLNRLYNLVHGLPAQDGPGAWEEMLRRGSVWTYLARRIDKERAVDAAPRPAPRPPVADRPSRLSVTQIQTLIRDPYAIYARKILRLKPLAPLTPRPDAALRGAVLHRILERFLREEVPPDSATARPRLMKIASEELTDLVPWAETRLIWDESFGGTAEWFLASETERRRVAMPAHIEVWGELQVTQRLRLVGKIDRIDRQPDGRMVIYDYKTGTPPSKKQMEHFDRQLMLEAAIVEGGGIGNVGPAEVAEIAYIGLGSTPKESRHVLRQPGDDDFNPAVELLGLKALIGAFEKRTRGYASRRAMESVRYDGDYDHLARYGEWDVTATPEGMDVG